MWRSTMYYDHPRNFSKRWRLTRISVWWLCVEEGIIANTHCNVQDALGIWEQINDWFQPRIYTRDREFLFYFNDLYRWPHTHCLISFTEIISCRNNHFYRLPKLTAASNHMSIGNFCHCKRNTCFKSRNIVVWMTNGVFLNYVTYVIILMRLIFE